MFFVGCFFVRLIRFFFLSSFGFFFSFPSHSVALCITEYIFFRFFFCYCRSCWNWQNKRTHTKWEKKINANSCLFCSFLPLPFEMCCCFPLFRATRAHSFGSYIAVSAISVGKKKRETNVQHIATHLIRLKLSSCNIRLSLSHLWHRIVTVRALHSCERMSFVCVCMWMLLYGRYRGWV